MLHNKEKCYYEHLAKLILEGLFPQKYVKLIERDKPDLLTDSGLGVEVTRALYNGDAESLSLFQYLRNPNNKNTIRTRSRINKLGYEVIEINGVPAGIMPKEAFWETTKEIEEAFIKKLNKIEQYSERVDLFIFAPSFDCYDIDMMIKFTKWARKEMENSNKKFGFVYVFDYSSIYECDLDNQSAIRRIIQKDKVGEWVEKSRKLLTQYD